MLNMCPLHRDCLVAYDVYECPMCKLKNEGTQLEKLLSDFEKKKDGIIPKTK